MFGAHMATYAIGDVQGCFETLQALLRRIEFDPSRDRLISVGDLVNRGPGSAAALRWAMSHEGAVSLVLGNHELHLIGRMLGVRRAKPRDTLDDLLDAPDRDAILDWLRSRPFALPAGDYLVVHAGLLPQWSIADTLRLAGEAQQALRGPDAEATIASLHEPCEAWREDLPAPLRIRSIVQSLTHLRTCSADGVPCLEFDGPPSRSPAGCRAWFERRGARRDEATVLFGHWAALGLHVTPRAICLDSGAGWGCELTAIRLEDRVLFHQPVLDPLPVVRPRKDVKDEIAVHGG